MDAIWRNLSLCIHGSAKGTKKATICLQLEVCEPGFVVYGVSGFDILEGNLGYLQIRPESLLHSGRSCRLAPLPGIEIDITLNKLLGITKLAVFCSALRWKFKSVILNDLLCIFYSADTRHGSDYSILSNNVAHYISDKGRSRRW